MVFPSLTALLGRLEDIRYVQVVLTGQLDSQILQLAGSRTHMAGEEDGRANGWQAHHNAKLTCRPH